MRAAAGTDTPREEPRGQLCRAEIVETAKTELHHFGAEALAVEIALNSLSERRDPRLQRFALTARRLRGDRLGWPDVVEHHIGAARQPGNKTERGEDRSSLRYGTTPSQLKNDARIESNPAAASRSARFSRSNRPGRM